MTDLIPTARLIPLIDRFEAENQTSNRIYAGLARRLYRVRNEQEFTTLDVADRLLVDMDMTEEWHAELADLYELPGQTRIRAPRPLRIPEEKLRAAITLYEQGNLSLPEIAAQCWQELGYPSSDACVQSIWNAMRKRGIRRRDTATAKLVHWSRRTCSGCGCGMDERTRGCQICTSRHYLRRKRGRAHAPAVIFDAACTGCGCGYGERTYACRQCIDRHSHRRLRRNPNAAQPPVHSLTGPKRAPAGGGHSSTRGGPISPPRGRRPSTERQAA